jgi:Cdc6-like AAA superfamily ATPase
MLLVGANMTSKESLSLLRQVISENLRVQRGGSVVEYISVGTALQDAKSKQNHAIFARRGCGKTLLLHHSSSTLNTDGRAIYLNCEDFKRHSFPNVLIEILSSIFKELDKNLSGWFGKKAKSKKIIQEIIVKLSDLQKSADLHDEEIRRKSLAGETSSLEAEVGAEVEPLKLKSTAKSTSNRSEEIERSFRVHRDKLQELDRWLPELKSNIRTFFELSSNIRYIILQIDDLYHLKRADQAFVVDYIHRLCKDIPMFFKIATLRHASTLYLDRDGQPIGAQSPSRNS